MANLKAEHNQAIFEIDSGIKRLQEEIESMKKKHAEIMDQIETDASQEIQDIEKKNQQDITKITDLSLKSKADLQLTKNKNNDLDAEIEQLERDKQDKNQLLQR